MSQRQLSIFEKVDRAQQEARRGSSDHIDLYRAGVAIVASGRCKKGRVESPWQKGERSHYVQVEPGFVRFEWDDIIQTKGRIRQKGFYTEVHLSAKKVEEVMKDPMTVEDVLVAILNLSYDGERIRKDVETTRGEIADVMLKKHRGGSQYRLISQALEVLSHITVSTNTIYLEEEDAYWEGEMGLLKTVQEPKRGIESPIIIRWDPTAVQYLNAGRIRPLDRERYYQLGSSVEKRIFRWAEKELLEQDSVEMDVVRMAHKELGYYVKYKYPSQILQGMEPVLRRMEAQGHFQYEIKESRTESGKAIRLTRDRAFETVGQPVQMQVTEALQERGFPAGEADHLVQKHGVERVLRQLEHCAYKQEREEIRSVTSWIRDAIEHNGGKGYQMNSKDKERWIDSLKQIESYCDKVARSLRGDRKETLREKAVMKMTPEERRLLNEGRLSGERAYVKARNRLIIGGFGLRKRA